MRVAFKMKLNDGCETEYKKRHDEIWNELKELLTRTGINNYSIFFDEETNLLFAYLIVDDKDKLRVLSNEPVMQKWWAYMKDIMATNDDGSPVTTPLKEVFYLP